MQSALPSSHLATKVLLSFILSAMIAASLFGNSLVVIAIVKERHLQTVANYLIMSLAIADLMVAMLVMPLSLYNELNEGVWVLGEPVCGLWIGFDVLCCTASILHLVAIAVDRYWSVTDINYATHKGTRRVVTMIAVIWLTSISISIPGHYGWPNPHGTLVVDDQCLINQDHYYTIYSTMLAFYVPLIVIISIYTRIFFAARERIRRSVGSSGFQKMTTYTRSTALTNGSEFQSQSSSSFDMQPTQSELGHNGFTHKSVQHTQMRKQQIEQSREKRALRTTIIITGSFVLSWLPFFLNALLSPFCPWCAFPPWLASITLWLGYMSVFINPLIYTVFSPDFRVAFKKILFRFRL